MNIKTYSLVTLISLCTVPAYGMENSNNTNDFDKSLIGMLHNFARQSVQNLYKNIEIAEKTAKKEKFKSTYNDKRQFMHNEDAVNSLTAQEKSDLLVSLQQNNQLIKECYSAEETWSEETHNKYHYSKDLIEQLEQKS